MAGVVLNREKCIGCGACVLDCPRALFYVEGEKARVREGFCIGCGHCVAVCPADAVRLPGGAEEEIRPYDPETFDIPVGRLLNFMMFRRSVRRFQPRPVEEEKLALLLEAARYSPTGGNRQMNRYILLGRAQEEITELTLRTLYQAAARAEEDPALKDMLYYRDKFTQMYAAWKERGEDPLFYRAPLVLLTVARSPGGSGRLDAGLASANVELMAHALGLGACYVGFFTMAAALEPALYQRLGVRGQEEVVSVLAMGYPDVTYRRTVNRRPARLTRL